MIKKCYRHNDKDKKLYAAKFVKYDDEALKILKREVAMIQKWEHEKFIYLIDVYIVRKYVVLIMEWYVHFVFICVAYCLYLCTEIPRVSKNMCCIACSTNDVISSGCTQNPTIVAGFTRGFSLLVFISKSTSFVRPFVLRYITLANPVSCIFHWDCLC